MNIIKELSLINLHSLRLIGIKQNILNTFYYFGANFILLVISIATQPIFSKYLDLKDFAILGYFSAIQAVLFPLFSLTLPFYYLSKYWIVDNGETAQSNLSFILNLLNISNGIIAVVSFILINAYFKKFNVSIPLCPYIFIVIAQLFFEKYKTFYLLECRVNKNGLRYFLTSMVQIAFNIGFSLYFVVSLNSGATGRMSGMLVGVVVTGLITLFLLISENKYTFSFRIDKNKFRKAIEYSVPLIIGAYAYFPIGNIDRLFLERLSNISEYGYYTIGLAISGFAGSFYQALYQSFEPDLYKFIAQKKYNQYILFTISYVIILTVLSLLFVFFSKHLVSFLTSGRYVYASNYANVFVFGVLFMQLGGVFEQLFTAFSATKLAMWRNILMGIFCTICYYFMIKEYQFDGAKIARVITSIFYVFSGAIMFLIYIKRRKSEIY